MSKLESMQRYAERLLVKAGIERPVTLQWSGTTCKFSQRLIAHAHYKTGVICVRRGLKDWRDTIRHEVAHLLPGGAGHQRPFTRVLARTGDRHAKAAMRMYDIAVKGKRHHHDWIRGSEQNRMTTAKGLVVTYDARCRLCGKQVPE